MSRRMRAALIVVVAAVLLSTSVAATALAADTGVSTANSSNDAEAAYVTDDGDVILVFNQSNTEDGSGHVGLNMSEGVTYGNFEWSKLDTDVTGAFSMQANRTQVNATGNVSVPRPNNVESLQFDLESETNEQNSKGDLDFNTTVGLPGDSNMIAAIFQKMDTKGEVRMTSDTLSSTGTANVSVIFPNLPEMRYDVDLEKADDGHSLTVVQERTVSGFSVGQWNTEAAAKETIRQQLQGISSAGGSTSEFTLDEYSFEETDEGGRLSVAYSVHIEGLNDVLQKAIATGVASQSSSFGAQAVPNMTEINESLGDLSIDRVDVSVNVGQGGGSANWNLSVRNYDGLATVYFDVMNASSSGGLFSKFTERYEKNFEAMQAADLVQTGTWDIDVKSSEDGSAIVANGSLQTRTDNWEAYVSERDSRDLPPIGTQRVEMHVAAEGDRVNGSASFLLAGENLYNRTLTMYEQAVQQAASSAGPTQASSVVEWTSTIRSAGFLGARLDASVEESTAVFEGGATFQNLTAITEHLDMPIENGSVERAYVEAGQNETHAYLRLNNATSSDDVESTVRAMSMVSDGTTIYTADEWDASSKDFPSLDIDSVQSYVPANTGGEDTALDNGRMSTTLLAGAGIGIVIILVVIGGLIWNKRE